jgi:hypothetical protein
LLPQDAGVFSMRHFGGEPAPKVHALFPQVAI